MEIEPIHPDKQKEGLSVMAEEVQDIACLAWSLGIWVPEDQNLNDGFTTR